MEKLSKSIVGYPLKETSPAGIERELIRRIRDDLGEFSDLALINPVLKIDSEDGNMSGNVTDGYGTVIIRVVNKDLHIPFIIYQKELLPFDTIRMGDEEVSYDMSKLRQIVIGLDKAQRTNNEDGNFEEVVSLKDVPTRNGFLGSIMGIRDEYQQNSMLGNHYTGDTFGVIDEGRMERFASTSIDMGEVFESFHEKLANVQIFSHDAVKTVAQEIEARFTKKAQTKIDAVSDVDIPTKTSLEIERSFNLLEADELMETAQVTSGNNVRFPVFSDKTLEYHFGRVYKKMRSALINPLNTKYTSLVIDSKGRYTYLKEREKFMVTKREPMAFNMTTVRAPAMLVGNVYTTEVDYSEIYAPFEIEDTFLSLDIFRTAGSEYKDLDNSNLLRDVIRAKQTLPVKIDRSREYGSEYAQEVFALVILKQSKQPFTKITFAELDEMIATQESSSDGLRAAKYAIESMVYVSGSSGDKKTTCFIVGDEPNVFMPLESRIQGFFSKANYLEEATMQFEKSAAYQKNNKARLFIEQGTNPVTYRLEWEFSAPQDGGEYKIETRSLEGLSPAKAKDVLSSLGFDERKKESFFRIVTQNGRMAEFSLPSVEVAAQVAPEDKGRSKAAEFVKGLVNTSLNASNFLPAMQDVISNGVVETITPVAGAAATSPKGEAIRQAFSAIFDKQAEESLLVASEMEKVAERLRGAEWFKVAQLLNMKHHLDKLAHATTNGFVKEAESVWSSLPQLENEIAKTTKDLILFNREQMMKTSSNIVPGVLVKEAVSQLDGLTAYTHVSKEMMERLAFFPGSNKGAKKTLKQMDNTFNQIQKKFQSAKNSMITSEINLRAAKQTGLESQNPDLFKKLEDDVYQKAEDLNGVLKELVSSKQNREQLQGQIEKKNRANALYTILPTALATGATFEAIND